MKLTDEQILTLARYIIPQELESDFSLADKNKLKEALIYCYQKLLENPQLSPRAFYYLEQLAKMNSVFEYALDTRHMLTQNEQRNKFILGVCSYFKNTDILIDNILKSLRIIKNDEVIVGKLQKDDRASQLVKARLNWQNKISQYHDRNAREVQDSIQNLKTKLKRLSFPDDDYFISRIINYLNNHTRIIWSFSMTKIQRMVIFEQANGHIIGDFLSNNNDYINNRKKFEHHVEEHLANHVPDVYQKPRYAALYNMLTPSFIPGYGKSFIVYRKAAMNNATFTSGDSLNRFMIGIKDKLATVHDMETLLSHADDIILKALVHRVRTGQFDSSYSQDKNYMEAQLPGYSFIDPNVVEHIHFESGETLTQEIRNILSSRGIQYTTGTNPYPNWHTEILAAAEKGNRQKLNEFKKHPVLFDLTNSKGQTPFTLLILNGHIQLAIDFLSHGNITSQDINGSMPHHYAIQLGHDELAYRICSLISYKQLMTPMVNKKTIIHLIDEKKNYALLMRIATVQPLLEQHIPSLKILKNEIDFLGRIVQKGLSIEEFGYWSDGLINILKDDDLMFESFIKKELTETQIVRESIARLSNVKYQIFAHSDNTHLSFKVLSSLDENKAQYIFDNGLVAVLAMQPEMLSQASLEVMARLNDPIHRDLFCRLPKKYLEIITLDSDFIESMGIKNLVESSLSRDSLSLVQYFGREILSPKATAPYKETDFIISADTVALLKNPDFMELMQRIKLPLNIFVNLPTHQLVWLLLPNIVNISNAQDNFKLILANIEREYINHVLEFVKIKCNIWLQAAVVNNASYNIFKHHDKAVLNSISLLLQKLINHQTQLHQHKNPLITHQEVKNSLLPEMEQALRDARRDRSCMVMLSENIAMLRSYFELKLTDHFALDIFRKIKNIYLKVQLLRVQQLAISSVQKIPSEHITAELLKMQELVNNEHASSLCQLLIDTTKVFERFKCASKACVNLLNTCRFITTDETLLEELEEISLFFDTSKSKVKIFGSSNKNVLMLLNKLPEPHSSSINSISRKSRAALAVSLHLNFGRIHLHMNPDAHGVFDYSLKRSVIELSDDEIITQGGFSISGNELKNQARSYKTYYLSDVAQPEKLNTMLQDKSLRTWNNMFARHFTIGISEISIVADDKGNMSSSLTRPYNSNCKPIKLVTQIGFDVSAHRLSGVHFGDFQRYILRADGQDVKTTLVPKSKLPYPQNTQLWQDAYASWTSIRSQLHKKYLLNTQLLKADYKIQLGLLFKALQSEGIEVPNLAAIGCGVFGRAFSPSYQQALAGAYAEVLSENDYGFKAVVLCELNKENVAVFNHVMQPFSTQLKIPFYIVGNDIMVSARQISRQFSTTVHNAGDLWEFGQFWEQGGSLEEYCAAMTTGYYTQHWQMNPLVLEPSHYVPISINELDFEISHQEKSDLTHFVAQLETTMKDKYPRKIDPNTPDNPIDLRIMNKFRDELLADKSLERSAINGALKAIEIFKFLKCNEAFLRFAVANRLSSDKEIQRHIYKYVDSYKDGRNDINRGVIRDFGDTSFHLNAYSSNDVDKAWKEISDYVGNFEDAIQAMSNCNLLKEWARTFNYQSDTGCLEQRMNEPWKFAKLKISERDQDVINLDDQMSKIFPKFKNISNEDIYCITAAYFEDKIGRECFYKDKVQKLTWAVVVDYLVTMFSYSHIDLNESTAIQMIPRGRELLQPDVKSIEIEPVKTHNLGLFKTPSGTQESSKSKDQLYLERIFQQINNKKEWTVRWWGGVLRQDGTKVPKSIPLILEAIDRAERNNNWTEARQIVDGLLNKTSLKTYIVRSNDTKAFYATLGK